MKKQNNNLVWSDESGDQRKSKQSKSPASVTINAKDLLLRIRRLTSGKGRTVIEITGLPDNQKWCKELAKDLKKALGVGGTYKNNGIELHGEKIEAVTAILEKKSLKWKKTGG